MSTLTIGNAKPVIPPTDQCYVGVFTDDLEGAGWAGWEADAQVSHVAFYGTYTVNNSSIAPQIASSSTVPATGLQIAWGFSGSVDLAHIPTGVDDAYITSTAQNLAAYGKPVFLRPNWEFQGTWYPWAAWDLGGNPVTGNTPADYVAAWQYFVTIIRSIAPNVSFVWTPFCFPPSESSPAYLVTDWYPGNAYVDWHGTDVYPGSDYFYTYDNTVWGVDQSVKYAARCGKPLMIAEWGIGQPQADDDDPIWINQHLDFIENNPVIKMHAYFSIDDAQNGVDYQLSAWPNTREVFRRRVANNPRYLFS